jgi:putative intracellular protease/amidase
MNKKILMVLTNHEQLGNTGLKTGWYLPEAAHPWNVFTQAGYDLSWTSPKGGFARMDGVDLHDPIQAEFLNTFSEKGPGTQPASAVNADEFDAIFFVGGHGAMWDFPAEASLNATAMSIYNRGGVVSAVCHGPAGLINLKLSTGGYLVAGKKVAAFTNDEEEAAGLTDEVPFLLSSILEQRGALMTAAPHFESHVVTDGRLVTGQNPDSATETAQAVVVALKTHEDSLVRQL